MAENNLKSVIEALLFASDRPLTIEQAKNALDNLAPDEIRKAIEELKSEYQQSGRGIRIAEIAGGFQMITAPDYGSFLKKLYKGRRVERLSKPALETLAIVAYKQPVTRIEIELLRNVNIDGVVKTLLEKNLIRIAGRKKAPGRPFAFGTTRQFLEYFGLKSIEELPKMEEFSSLVEKNELELTDTAETQTAEVLDGSSEPA